MNGSIPELYPEEHVTKANAILKVVSTAAILLGTALAGFALDQNWLPPQVLLGREVPFGIILTAVIIVLVAASGLTSCFGVYSRPASGAHPPFPLTGPLDSLREFIALKRDPLLLLTIIADCFFYFLSQFILLVNNPLGLNQLGLSKFQTSLMSASLAIGVSIGALVAAKITHQHRWTHVLMPGAVGMGMSLIVLGLAVSLSGSAVPAAAVFGLLALAGIFGGMFMIPITAFIQVRPEVQHKGRVLGVSYFTTFACMMLAGLLFSLIDGGLGYVETTLKSSLSWLARIIPAFSSLAESLSSLVDTLIQQVGQLCPLLVSGLQPSETMLLLGVFALLTGGALQMTLRRPQFRIE
jgi:hypothetical protein